MTATLDFLPQQILLQGISWSTYQALVMDLELEPGKRLTYDRGALEIRSPLPIHERYKSLLARLVEVVTEEMEIEIASLGSTTWSREDQLKGLEADECFYIANESIIRGRSDIDLRIDPPPDLVIEVDITSSSIPRLPIYQALGVPEIWRYDGEAFEILGLTDQGYCPQATSIALPLLNREEILLFLHLSSSLGETSLIRRYREWIRAQLALKLD